MVKYKSNQLFYELHLSELEEDAVRVLSFQGEEKISRQFLYRIDLLSEDPELDPTAILNKKATFVLTRGDEDPIQIYGIISYFEQRGKTPNYVSYYAELVPKMWRTGLTFRNEIFQNMNVEKIVTEVLKSDGFAGQDYKFELSESYPDLEFVVQYRETDFDFINRWLEHFGIFYYFLHEDDNDVIVFTDDNEKLPAIEQADDIFYNPNRDPLSESETISRITCQSKVVTGLHQLKDYNYRHPSRDLKAESQIDSEAIGLFYDYGDHYREVKEGEFLAKVRNEETLAQSKVYKGQSDCRLFSAGFTFKMGKHYSEAWNEILYVLTEVRSRGNQQGLFAYLPDATKFVPTYENEFVAIPGDIAFRPERITKKPKIDGFMNAKIDGGGDGQYAELDDQGRYKVIIPYDLSGKSGGEASQFIRMAQPYAGAGYGMHFPLHIDTEVALSFVGGDPDRPIIMNSLTNPATTSPVTSSNQTTSVIRDNGNNEIILDSADGGQIIHIKQACGHEFKMDTGGEKIELRDKYGNEIVMDSAAGTITLHSPTHESKMVLGKSIEIESMSDLVQLFQGNYQGDIIGDMKLNIGADVTEFYAGAENKITVGGRFRVVVGTKSELLLINETKVVKGLKAEFTQGIKIGSHGGKEYTTNPEHAEKSGKLISHVVGGITRRAAKYYAEYQANAMLKAGAKATTKANDIEELAKGKYSAEFGTHDEEAKKMMLSIAGMYKAEASKYQVDADQLKADAEVNFNNGALLVKK
jgi:type VI secretion system secreted protein VgrG